MWASSKVKHHNVGTGQEQSLYQLPPLQSQTFSVFLVGRRSLRNNELVPLTKLVHMFHYIIRKFLLIQHKNLLPFGLFLKKVTLLSAWVSEQRRKKYKSQTAKHLSPSKKGSQCLLIFIITKKPLLRGKSDITKHQHIFQKGKVTYKQVSKSIDCSLSFYL